MHLSHFRPAALFANGKMAFPVSPTRVTGWKCAAAETNCLLVCSQVEFPALIIISVMRSEFRLARSLINRACFAKTQSLSRPWVLFRFALCNTSRSESDFSEK